MLLAAVTTPPILICMHGRHTETLPACDLALEPLWAGLLFSFEALSIRWALC